MEIFLARVASDKSISRAYYIVCREPEWSVPWRGAPNRDAIAQIKRPVQEIVEIVYDMVPHPEISFDYNALISEIDRDLMVLSFSDQHTVWIGEAPLSTMHQRFPYRRRFHYSNAPHYCDDDAWIEEDGIYQLGPRHGLILRLKEGLPQTDQEFGRGLKMVK
uniref:Uncharacterized protein n=1 Tax=Ditylenchus dipsaci TaxID=166011 RepID=A0A915DSD2_9BILA